MPGQTFGPKTGDATETGGGFNNALAKALEGVKITPPKSMDTSLGAMQANKPPLAQKIENISIRPSVSDLFAGYVGKANVARYEEQIAELMKTGVPSLEEVGKLFPSGSKLYNFVEVNYPSWSAKLEQAISKERKGTKVGDKTGSLSEKELHSKYDGVIEKRFYADPSGKGHWIKIAEGDLDVSKFRIISSVAELNQRWIDWRELDKLLQKYKTLDKRDVKRNAGAQVPDAKPEGIVPERSKPKTETSEEKEMRIQREQADMEMTRNAAMFTLAKISNVEELWAKNEKEGNEKFNKKTRELWKKFAVHGMIRTDQKTGKPFLASDTDLDGKVSLGLLKKAGLDISDLSYVHPGTYEEGRLTVDSGGRDGASFEMSPDDEITLFFDHHGEKSGNKTSAAAITYKILVGLKLLDRDPILDKVVEFVTQADNWTFPDQEKFFDKSYQTVLGLQHRIGFNKLAEFVKGKKKFTDSLSPQELKELGLEKSSDRQQKIVEGSIKKFEQLEKNGQVFQGKSGSKYGRVVVSVDRELEGRYAAARYFGCNTFIEWNPTTGGFAIYSKEAISDDFGEGVRVRDKMWMRPPKEGQPLKTSLGEIIKKIGGEDFQPVGKLAEYLEEEKKAIEKKKERSEDEQALFGLYENKSKLFWQRLGQENIWDGYPDILKKQVIRTETGKRLKEWMDELGDFTDGREGIIEEILRRLDKST